METELLSSELLDRVWWRWLENVVPTKSNVIQAQILQTVAYKKIPYGNTNQSMKTAQDFEAWLFDQGAEVIQIQGQRHLKFVNAAEATMFTMRWL